MRLVGLFFSVSCARCQMSYSDELCDYWLEVARSPCTQTRFAGSDMRFSSEYEVLESELAKVQSIHGNGQPDWHKVLETSEILLRQQSKDLKVAVWLTWALHQRESFPGLLAGLGFAKTHAYRRAGIDLMQQASRLVSWARQPPAC